MRLYVLKEDYHKGQYHFCEDLSFTQEKFIEWCKLMAYEDWEEDEESFEQFLQERYESFSEMYDDIDYFDTPGKYVCSIRDNYLDWQAKWYMETAEELFNIYEAEEVNK